MTDKPIVQYRYRENHVWTAWQALRFDYDGDDGINTYYFGDARFDEVQFRFKPVLEPGWYWATSHTDGKIVPLKERAVEWYDERAIALHAEYELERVKPPQPEEVS